MLNSVYKRRQGAMAMSEHINLTAAEWSVMECLWGLSPQTGRELTAALAAREGWNRSTTLTLLSRLEAKGAVTSESAGGVKAFSPTLRREDAALHEAEDFLTRVYKGSVSMMVSALTKKQALSKAEIEELYAMLENMKGGEAND